MTKETIESRVHTLEMQMINKANNDHIHPLVIIVLVLILIMMVILLINWTGSINTKTVSNYYDNRDSFCKYYNMSYRYIQTSITQPDIYECYKVINDSITLEKQITQINNRWVFK